MRFNQHADFYLGRGRDARWLGSAAELGDPYDLSIAPCGPEGSGVEVVTASDAEHYTALVAALLQSWDLDAGGRSYLPDGGWPWPWPDSTGYVCAFDAGIWLSHAGGPWFRPDPEQPACGELLAVGPCPVHPAQI